MTVLECSHCIMRSVDDPALELVGAPAGPARLPILPLGEADRARLRDILDRMGMLQKA